MSKSTLLSLTLILLAACSASPPKPAVVELKPTTLSAIDGSEEKLYQNAQRLYEQELYSVARDYFQSLKDRYPTGAYPELAEIKIAETYTQTREYSTASNLFEEFARNHPSSQATPYALAMAGRNIQLTFGGVGKDISPVERALEKYKEFLSRFPDSPLTSDVTRYKIEALGQLAASEESVADFYRRKNKVAAASAREEYVAKNISPLLTPPDSIAMASLNLPEIQRQKIPAIVVAKRVKLNSALKSTDSTFSRHARDSELNSSQRNVRHLNFIRRIECKNSEFKQIYFYFNEAAGMLDKLPSSATLKPKNGALSFPLPVAIPNQEQATTKDCFGLGDLAVNKDGIVNLKTSSSADVMVVSNPTRLLMVLND